MKRPGLILGAGVLGMGALILFGSRRSSAATAWPWAALDWPDMEGEIRESQSGGDSGGDYQPTNIGGMAGVRDMVARLFALGLPPEVEPLILLQAYTESRGNPDVGLGLPNPDRWPPWVQPNVNASEALQRGETRAAERSYNRNREWADESPSPAGHWQFGSGGLYGLLPTTALYWARGTPELASGELGPWDVFAPWRSTVFYADYIRRVMALPHFRDLPAQHRNALAIKRAGASLALVRDYAEQQDRSRRIREKVARASSSLGIPQSYATAPLSADWSGWDAMRAIEADPT